MCGIHGIVCFDKRSGKNIRNKIKLMLKMAKHRGSDEEDILILGRVGLGTNRLAIIAPDEYSTIQSMIGDKKYALFNGEIVNHQELRKLLKYPPDRQTDSAIILPLLKQFGPKFIEKLAGMFAIAAYDESNNKLQLWRDPLGIKPLYYYHSKDYVVFSSEIKAIYAVLDNQSEIDFAAIDHCLKYRFNPGESSIFPDIKRVLPGETVIFDGDKILRKRYWFPISNKKPTSKNIQIEQFRDMFVKIIKEYIQADVKGGFFVSGGLDSSFVTALALKQVSSFNLPISIKFLPNPVEDEEYGKLLEKFFKRKFEWVVISDQLARQTLHEVVSYIDEPLENPIHIGTYLMAKRAHELGVKSVLTGDGSDEFFLGYKRIGCWFNNSSANPSVDYPKLLWTLKPDDAAELYTEEAVSSIKPMLDSFNHQVEPFKDINQVLMFEQVDHLSEYHNMRLDRMTMAHGVEARVPFQDRRLIERALQIPLSKLFGVSGKEWLQEVAKPWVPHEILKRPKVHFPSLSDQWTSGKGSEWVSEILLDRNAQTKKWIKSDILERYIEEHKNKTQSRGRLLWALVVLELWLHNLSSWRRSYIDNI